MNLDRSNKIITTLREEYDNIFSTKVCLKALKIQYKLLSLLLLVSIPFFSHNFVRAESLIERLIFYCLLSVSILSMIKLLNNSIKRMKNRLFNDRELSNEYYYIRKLQINNDITKHDIFFAHDIMKRQIQHSNSNSELLIISFILTNIFIPIILTMLINTVDHPYLIIFTFALSLIFGTLIISMNGVFYNRQKQKDKNIIYYLDLYRLHTYKYL